MHPCNLCFFFPSQIFCPFFYDLGPCFLKSVGPTHGRTQPKIAGGGHSKVQKGTLLMMMIWHQKKGTCSQKRALFSTITGGGAAAPGPATVSHTSIQMVTGQPAPRRPALVNPHPARTPNPGQPAPNNKTSINPHPNSLLPFSCLLQPLCIYIHSVI